MKLNVVVCNYINRNILRMKNDVPLHDAKITKPILEKQRNFTKNNVVLNEMIWDKCKQDLEIKNYLFQIKNKFGDDQNHNGTIMQRIIKSLKSCDCNISMVELVSRINNPPIKDSRRIEIVTMLKLMLGIKH